MKLQNEFNHYRLKSQWQGDSNWHRAL